MFKESEVYYIILQFCKMIETEFGTKVKHVHSDNGGEFIYLKAFLLENGIIHETFISYTPQQNGCVERKYCHILNVHVFSSSSTSPYLFLGRMCSSAIYLINRTLSNLLQGTSPFEKLHGITPNYDIIRSFGCLCYVHDRHPSHDKFYSHSRKCLFIGYPLGKRGWPIYDLATKEFFVSRDVVFYEQNFPFSHLPP